MYQACAFTWATALALYLITVSEKQDEFNDLRAPTQSKEDRRVLRWTKINILPYETQDVHVAGGQENAGTGIVNSSCKPRMRLVAEWHIS